VPPNAAIGTHVPDFEPVGVLERWQPGGHRARRRRVARGRRLLVERLVRPLVIELFAKNIKPTLLGGETPGRRACRLRLQCAMHPFMPPILRWTAGFDELGDNAQAHPPCREGRQARARLFVANGTPLSVRIRFGKPYSLNSPVKIGLAWSTAVDGRAWQPRR